tara:strand:- start:253 stop:564 length:312 start_codon:yes stop_codon:yes gene_type:complete
MNLRVCGENKIPKNILTLHKGKLLLYSSQRELLPFLTRFLMNVNNLSTLGTILKKAEQKKESQTIGIIDIAKAKGFIDKLGKVTPEGKKFLQERIVNSSLTVS